MKLRIFGAFCVVLLTLLVQPNCTPRYGVAANQTSVRKNPYDGGLEATTQLSPEMTPDQIQAVGNLQKDQLEFGYNVMKQENEMVKKAQESDLAKTVIRWAGFLVAFIVFVALRIGRKDKQKRYYEPEVTRLEPEHEKPSAMKEIIQVVEKRMK